MSALIIAFGIVSHFITAVIFSMSHKPKQSLSRFGQIVGLISLFGVVWVWVLAIQEVISWF